MQLPHPTLTSVPPEDARLSVTVSQGVEGPDASDPFLEETTKESTKVLREKARVFGGNVTLAEHCAALVSLFRKGEGRAAVSEVGMFLAPVALISPVIAYHKPHKIEADRSFLPLEKRYCLDIYLSVHLNLSIRGFRALKRSQRPPVPVGHSRRPLPWATIRL